MNQEKRSGAHPARVNAPQDGSLNGVSISIIDQGAPIMERIRHLQEHGTPEGARGQATALLTEVLTEHVAIEVAEGLKLIEAPLAAQGAQGPNFVIDTGRAYALLLQGLSTPRGGAWSALITMFNTAYEWGRINGKKEGSRRKRKATRLD